MTYQKQCKYCGIIFYGRSNKDCCSKECSSKYKVVRINRWRSEMREVAKELGNCSKCFKSKENPFYKTCLKCRMQKRLKYRQDQKLKGGKKK